MARKEPEPIRITTATRSHSDDIGARQRRYIISMSIRTVCFILAIVLRGHWYSWVLIAASFVLPYIAVVMANAGASADPAGPVPYDPNPDRKSLEGPAQG
jgi:Protein of unknown function (DUF3099)